MGLREEWRNISLLIKTQQSFDGYSLVDLYNVLKAHESQINEIAQEGKLILEGPLTLMLKVTAKDSEVESIEEDNFEVLDNSEDEAVAYYSNNKVKSSSKISSIRSTSKTMS